MAMQYLRKLALAAAGMLELVEY